MDNAVKQSHISRRLSRWEKGDGNISHEELESLKNRLLDEEVIGIITMEDVLEEFLQEEIRDETDQHVEIHDKIRVNFLSTRSSSASMGRDYWRSPETSSTTASCLDGNSARVGSNIYRSKKHLLKYSASQNDHIKDEPKRLPCDKTMDELVEMAQKYYDEVSLQKLVELAQKLPHKLNRV